MIFLREILIVLTRKIAAKRNCEKSKEKFDPAYSDQFASQTALKKNKNLPLNIKQK